MNARDARRVAWLIVRGEAPEGYESLVEAVRLLRASFPSKPDSWFYRAVLRCLAGVKTIRHGHWLRGGRYRCDCFFRQWGRRRRREICTHIAAVMLHRRQRKISEYCEHLP